MSKDIVRVLLVEDSPSDARLLCEALQNYPLQQFEIERAERVDEALALLAQRPFDVVLLDLNLPDSRGLETCARLSRAAGRASIIILTGADDEAIAAEAMRLGVQDYLVKGQAQGSVVGRTIRYTVERSQSQEALRQANEQLQEQAEELQTQAEELAAVNATLRKSEERLHLAMEAGKVGIWEWEVGTECVEWSQGVYAWLGYRPGEVTPSHRALRQRIHPQDLARRDRALKDSLERCDDYRCEFRVVWADGSVHWVETRGQYSYLDDGSGLTLRMRGVLSDIDSRKQAEEALRASEERYRKLFEANLAGVYLTKPDGTILDFNDAMMRMLGYDAREEVFQHRSSDFYADPEFRQELIRLLQKDGIVPAQEAVLQRKDGSVLHALGSAVLLVDEQTGEPCIQGVAIDITERKRTEKAMRESEERLKRAQEIAHLGSWELDLVKGELTWSDEVYRIFGVEPQQFDATYEAFLDAVHPEDRVAVDAAYYGSIRAGRDSYEIEHRIVRQPSGEVRIIHEKCRHIRDDSGKIVRSVGMAHDITERKRAEETLREWNATLESNVAQRTAELLHRTRQLQRLTLELSETEDRERKRMAEILHDDLQQVLAAAKFHLSLMRNQVRHDASLQALATQIDHMLKDAIEKSRSLSHELSPAVLYHSDFAETLRWLAGQMQAKHGLVVHVHAHGPVHLQSDAIKAFLYKTAQELLFNAVKHAGVKEAKIRVRRCGRCFCVSVSDHGRGFDLQGLDQAAGFGLWNIRERIELLGGRMKIKSAPGQGSTFSIVVPDAGSRDPGREWDEVQGSRGEGRTPVPRLPGLAPLRVLLADDHEIVRQGLALLLGEEDMVEVVGEAANGREAVDLADQLHPDVVIMDVSIPVMSGDEATRQIKGLVPQIRVVALSMFEEPDVMERMHQAGAEGYVLKTAPSQELLAAIRGGSG